jgi:hypothetical protein
MDPVISSLIWGVVGNVLTDIVKIPPKIIKRRIDSDAKKLINGITDWIQ